MCIAGHGIDTVDLRRFGVLSSDERYLARCFTTRELRASGTGETRTERLAARFAAKEAVLKALGTGLVDGILLTDIEILFVAGRPSVRLGGRVAQLASDLGVTCWHVSMTHGTEHAIASAIACSDT